MHGGTLDDFLAEEGILEERTIRRGSTNVYADLGYPDAEGMKVKAALVSRLASILKARRYSQTLAAEITSLPQPKLFAILSDENFSNVKACEGATCTLMFADHTRGRSRRWCSMGICGNRAKQSAHRHQRKKQR